MRLAGKLLPLVVLMSLLAMMVPLVAIPHAVAAATTWHVNPGDSIQAAVDGASPGDTIEVAAGTYVGNVTINRTLTLKGANFGISAGAVPGTRGPESIIKGGVEIAGNNVVIDGFKIDGPAASGQIDGIYIHGLTSGHTIANNVLVGLAGQPGHETRTVSDGWAMEFSVSTSAIVVRNNYIGNWWSTYLNPTNPSANILFEGNHFHNNLVGIGSDHLNDVNIQLNKFTSNTLEGFGTSDVGSNVRAHNNDFVGNGAGINNYGDLDGDGAPIQTIDATNNWWGNSSGPYNATSNPGGLGNAVSDNVLFSPWTGLAAPTVASVNPSQGTKGQVLTNVIITGTGLTGATSVSFGAGITTDSFTVNNSTKITANITIGTDTYTGFRDVSVTTPGGTGTKAGGFRIVGTAILLLPAKGPSVAAPAVDFQWKPVDGAQSYMLGVSTSSSVSYWRSYKLLKNVGNVTSYVDIGYPMDGKRYFCWVWAVDANGISTLLVNKSYFYSVAPIGTPTLVSPAKGATVIGTSVTFQWNAVPGAVDYKLLVSTSSSLSSTYSYKLNKNVGNVTSYVDTGYPMDGKKYYWWVWAYDADGYTSTQSLVVANRGYFYDISPCGTPTLVSPAKGAKVAGTSVTFQWNAVDGAQSYKLLVSTRSSLSSTYSYKLNKNVGNVTTYVDTGYPMNGKTYYWWVWAYDADGNPSTLSQVVKNGRYFTSTS